MIIIIIVIILVFAGLADSFNGMISDAINAGKNSKVRRYNTEALRQSEFVKIVDRDEDGSLYAYIIENENGTRRKVYANKDRFVIAVGDTGTATYYSNYRESFNRFLIISLDVLICRYSPLFRAFPALFISEEPHKSFYYPLCFRSQK